MPKKAEPATRMSMRSQQALVDAYEADLEVDPDFIDFTRQAEEKHGVDEPVAGDVVKDDGVGAGVGLLDIPEERSLDYDLDDAPIDSGGNGAQLYGSTSHCRTGCGTRTRAHAK